MCGLLTACGPRWPGRRAAPAPRRPGAARRPPGRRRPTGRAGAGRRCRRRGSRGTTRRGGATTSRAVQPATGAGTVQSRVPTHPVGERAGVPAVPVGGGVIRHGVRRCHRRASVQLRVALVDADLHAAAQPGVAALEAVDQRLGVQPGAAVAEVLERQGLQRDALRHALEGEGLHDPVRADLVEAAVEAVLLRRRWCRRSASCPRCGRPSSRWWCPSSCRARPTGR